MTAIVVAWFVAGCGGGDDAGGSGTTAAGPAAKCLPADPGLEAAARAHVRDVTIGKEERFDAERLDVSVCRTGDIEASAVVTIYGLRDDSIQDVRHLLTLVSQRGFWNVVGDVETRRCRPGRGQQDFGAALCV